MPLESLLELVKTLSDRVDEHGAALRQSEALTRYALIDPFLLELGWDTSDPDMVIPEYRSGNGRADYALMNNGNPAMMVEAKSLSTPLQDVLSQGVQYCLMEGTSYFAVTDGRIWEIYETHKPVPINDKRILRFDLKDNPAQVCLKALALWNYSVESGQVSEAQTPILTLSPDQSEPSQVLPTEELTPQPVSVVSAIEDGVGWLPLSEVEPEQGISPTEVRFPDGSSTSATSWRKATIEVVRWLLEKGHLKPSNCPVQTPSAKNRYLVHTTDSHPSGNGFISPALVGSLYLETNANPGTLMNQTRFIIQHVGQDPAHFKVRLS